MVHTSVYPSVCVFICLYILPSVCPSVCVFIRMCVHPSVCPSACMSIRLCVYPSVCPSVCISVYIFTRLHVFPSVWPSVIRLYVQWRRYLWGIGARAPSSLGNSVHSAAAASLTVKISKITKEKHVLNCHLSRQKRAQTQENRLKQSWKPKEILGRGGEEKIYAVPPHLIPWRRHCVCPSICMSFRLYVHPSVCPSVCMSIRLCFTKTTANYPEALNSPIFQASVEEQLYCPARQHNHPYHSRSQELLNWSIVSLMLLSVSMHK